MGKDQTIVVLGCLSVALLGGFLEKGSLPTALFVFHAAALLGAAEILHRARSPRTIYLWTRRFHLILYTLLLSSVLLLRSILRPDIAPLPPLSLFCLDSPLRHLLYNRVWWVLWFLDAVLLLATCRVLDWSLATLLREWFRAIVAAADFSRLTVLDLLSAPARRQSA